MSAPLNRLRNRASSLVGCDPGHPQREQQEESWVKTVFWRQGAPQPQSGEFNILLMWEAPVSEAEAEGPLGRTNMEPASKPRRGFGVPSAQARSFLPQAPEIP